jgi:large subunit ribosomal protein L21
MLAVIKTGGKQYLVKPGDKIQIEKIEGEVGKEVSFKEVLLLEKNNKVEIGFPIIEGAEVLGKILEQGRGDKTIVFKYKSKIRYKVKRGHRQHFTEVEIKKISEKE